MLDGKFDSPERYGVVAKPVFCGIDILFRQCVTRGQDMVFHIGSALSQDCHEALRIR
jgi:hypothetical protein